MEHQKSIVNVEIEETLHKKKETFKLFFSL